MFVGRYLGWDSVKGRWDVANKSLCDIFEVTGDGQ